LHFHIMRRLCPPRTSTLITQRWLMFLTQPYAWQRSVEFSSKHGVMRNYFIQICNQRFTVNIWKFFSFMLPHLVLTVHLMPNVLIVCYSKRIRPWIPAWHDYYLLHLILRSNYNNEITWDTCRNTSSQHGFNASAKGLMTNSYARGSQRVDRRCYSRRTATWLQVSLLRPVFCTPCYHQLLLVWVPLTKASSVLRLQIEEWALNMKSSWENIE
jgi:hypothetical protein